MKNLLLLLFSFAALALASVAAAKEDPAAAMDPGAAPPEAIGKWQDMRFGMFIHWGPVSLKGTEIGWSRGQQIPLKEYDNLYKRFDPVKFDANAWARTAKEAGMKYLQQQVTELVTKYGESIYGTRGGPVKPGKGFVTTRKGNAVYLHVFSTAPEEITLPALPRNVTGAEILGGGGSVEVDTGAKSWTVKLPAEHRKPIDTVVKITLDGSAMDLDAVAPPTDFQGAKASNVFQN